MFDRRWRSKTGKTATLLGRYTWMERAKALDMDLVHNGVGQRNRRRPIAGPVKVMRRQHARLERVLGIVQAQLQMALVPTKLATECTRIRIDQQLGRVKAAGAVAAVNTVDPIAVGQLARIAWIALIMGLKRFQRQIAVPDPIAAARQQ